MTEFRLGRSIAKLVPFHIILVEKAKEFIKMVIVMVVIAIVKICILFLLT